MARGQPLFSVVIPTYARPAQLSECLEALVGVQLPDESFEVVVVDDGSGAPPEAVVHRFRDRLDVRLLVAAHGGPAAARNHGVASARGRFLAFTDDDCRPAPQWLHALAERFTAVPEHIVGGRTLNALTHNAYAATSQLILDVAYAYYNDHGTARFFASNNLALAAQRFRAIGGFDASFTTSEDRELCARWLREGYRMTYAPEALIYHAHPLSVRRFWRQHFGYGRGAYRFHHSGAQRGGGRFRPDPTFYKRLIAAPFNEERGPRMLLIAALVLFSQLANSAGYLYERQRRDEAVRP
jgi:glycosyltransferase involved in cell wall biosynthesis